MCQIGFQKKEAYSRFFLKLIFLGKNGGLEQCDIILITAVTSQTTQRIHGETNKINDKAIEKLQKLAPFCKQK